ncbi:DNA-binding transcriptional MerR regulator [Salsuginibacillus halophilus]|uniref:DNA-binding transcriptional MerR regulator n=1 Tax=Salsuginibacillus halophilus TaxID=517424 RepID=A0A2P8HW25_9BACI|nr:MerR family DNA-binding transcriptional regulator [Salsuginibacillus halophilus]PSL50416.1 DNA-binding transcriptional MerR regulator [Salsuginibacillus halophilus]
MQYTISDLAAQFDISTRTIRYYEEKGLLTPERDAQGQRLYHRKDRARLQLILRGKRFGFSLEEIEEMITLFDEDRSGKKQLEVTVAYGEEKIQALNERIEDMEALRNEMQELHKDFQKRLQALED